MNESKLNIFIDRLLAQRVLMHILFWLGMLVAYNWLFFRRDMPDAIDGLLLNAVIFPSIIGTSYFLAYYQIPQQLYKKKYLQFILTLVLNLYFSMVLARLLTVYLAETVLGMDGPLPNMWALVFISVIRLIQGYLITISIGPAIMILIKIMKQYVQEKQKAERLEKEKHKAELNFLKAQIHPHFLFNTLNNLYTLTLQKSDQAPKTVIKLSEMLDYMLYQCNGKSVPIHKEVKLLNNYIDLEKLRYGERLELNFEENIDNAEAQIAPLILLSIVENAFKHGVSGAIKKPKVDIRIEVKGNMLKASVYNTKPQTAQHDPVAFKAGIGVSNISRQLELIYPDAYTLEKEEKEESYMVNLEVQLNSV